MVMIAQPPAPLRGKRLLRAGTSSILLSGGLFALLPLMHIVDPPEAEEPERPVEGATQPLPPEIPPEPEPEPKEKKPIEFEEPPQIVPRSPLDLIPIDGTGVPIPMHDGMPKVVPPEIISIEDAHEQPVPISQRSPRLPDRSVRGTVTVEFVIDERGRVRDARVVRGIDRNTDRAILDAVRLWKFNPARDRYGNAIAVQARIPISIG